MLEAVEGKKALSHLTNEEATKSEIHMEQVEKRIRESLEGLEAEEKHKTIWEDQERLGKKKRDELLKELERKPAAR